MITGLMFRNGVISGANNISNSRQAVDALNIFPVPDGDTGTNMSMTINAAAKEMAELPDDCSIAEVSKKAASALLRGARGNSGVILSLIFRGFSKAFKGIEEASGKDIANAFRAGTDAAYKAVMKPTEGTILTVVRCAAEAAEKMAEIQDDPIEVSFAALQAAKEALAKTPEQLPVLKKAGVVDAGGQGFVLILQGFESVFENGAIVSSVSENTASTEKKEAVAQADEEIKYGYCSEFLIEKEKGAKETDPIKLRAFLESVGDCVVVVDDNDIIKVHVHSNCPGTVIQTALKYGQLINIKIDNMRHQHKEVEAAKANETEALSVAEPENEYGFVAVCAGNGLTELFKDLGADVVVSGGQTMNPSTDDIVNAVLAVPAKVVYVLPNNKNIIMAAQVARDEVTDRELIVLETKTIPQGITAMLNFDESEDKNTNKEQMIEAASNTQTATVTFAARNSEINGTPITEGQIMGLCNGDIKHIGEDKEDIALKAIDELYDKDLSSLITIIYGKDVSEEDAQKLEAMVAEQYSGDIEVSVVDGGQPIYYYIISVE